MAELGAGDVRIHQGGGIESASPETTSYNVSWGFVEVLGDRVTILASDALKPEEIDVPRAEQQLDRGEEMWKEAGENEDAYDEALRVISEAEAKISSASEKH
jgi:F-type H+-transporting ATPase subunit epsilon